jgi:hypothetical protein
LPRRALEHAILLAALVAPPRIGRAVTALSCHALRGASFVPVPLRAVDLAALNANGAESAYTHVASKVAVGLDRG